MTSHGAHTRCPGKSTYATWAFKAVKAHQKRELKRIMATGFWMDESGGQKMSYAQIQNLRQRGQTQLESLIEASLNTASGFVVSYIFWVAVVVPLFRLDISHADNFIITGMFTVLSVGRSYLWRRFFNAGAHNLVRNLLRRKV